MFELESPTTLKLRSASPRKQHHGEDLVQAIDLDFRWETSNESLSLLDPWLRSTFYRNAAADDGQDNLDGVPDALPNLRVSKLVMPLKWDWEGVGYTMHIDHGLGWQSDIVLTGCNVKKLKLDLKEGGTAVIDFQVQCSTDVTKKMLGELCDLEGSELDATLLAPAEMPEAIDGTVGHPGLAEAEAAGQQQLDATDAFLTDHAEA